MIIPYKHKTTLPWRSSKPQIAHFSCNMWKNSTIYSKITSHCINKLWFFIDLIINTLLLDSFLSFFFILFFLPFRLSFQLFLNCFYLFLHLFLHLNFRLHWLSTWLFHLILVVIRPVFTICFLMILTCSLCSKSSITPFAINCLDFLFCMISGIVFSFSCIIVWDFLFTLWALYF